MTGKFFDERRAEAAGSTGDDGCFATPIGHAAATSGIEEIVTCSRL
jgi:hypothetical protein